MDVLKKQVPEVSELRSGQLPIYYSTSLGDIVVPPDIPINKLLPVYPSSANTPWHLRPQWRIFPSGVGGGDSAKSSVSVPIKNEGASRPPPVPRDHRVKIEPETIDLTCDEEEEPGPQRAQQRIGVASEPAPISTTSITSITSSRSKPYPVQPSKTPRVLKKIILPSTPAAASDRESDTSGRDSSRSHRARSSTPTHPEQSRSSVPPLDPTEMARDG